jgi:hypothetical protein
MRSLKLSVQTPHPSDNGQPPGDAHEPAGADPGGFDLADVEVAEAPAAAEVAVPDPFNNLTALRLTGDQVAKLGVKPVILTMPVGKPDRSWFVRVHPDDAYAFPTAVLEMRGQRGERDETYLVAPHLRESLSTIITLSAKMLFTAVSRQGKHFFWPVTLPRPDGRSEEWSRTAREAAQMARKNWVRIQADMSLGAYRVHVATGNLPEPEWPDLSLSDLLRIAFKDRFIGTLDHPVVRKLREGI